MADWMISSLAFLAAFFAVLAANAALQKLSEIASGEQRRLDAEVQAHKRQRLKSHIRVRNLDDLLDKTGRPRSNLLVKLSHTIQQSGLLITPRQLIARSLLLAIVAGTAAWVLLDDFTLALLIAAVAAAVPLMYVVRARGKRLEKLLSQLPDTFELMSRVMRSGQTISQAMQVIADQGAPPVSLEFYHCYEQMNLGMTPESALRDLALRTGLLEMKIFSVAVLVQRETGGNLSELFDKMGTTVRERFRIRGMIKSLTSEGRMQAVVLSSLPVAMFGLLMVIQPEYEKQLLNYPWMIMAALGLIGLGALWIRSVVNFDY